MPDAERLRAALSDRYRIEREVGSGGMATVYLAEDLKHHRAVAIKVLHADLGAALGPERFLREIEISAQLHHPHILPLYDSGEAGGILFYVMPFVEGESLRDRLVREKQLPLDDALRITREVADALSYAHSRGVVHRDIKPENVLFEAGHAVVADFGIARAIDAASGPQLTSTGLAVGTPAYMSPEQAAGSRNLDGRSDLYALACVLYEMLAGQPPFTGPTVESIVHQHLAVEPPEVTRLRPAVPAAVAAALQRALAKTPADRFNPVALFGEALGSMAAAPTAPLAAATGRRRVRWPPVVAGAAAVAVLALATGRRFVHGSAAARHPRTAIAVLPFENLSAAPAQAYFAPGLQDEVLTQLSKVAALTVISRTSVMGYAGTTKPVRQIADELGVGSMVEGSVQVVGSHLRVNVQLIDAATDAHRWAEQYDRTLNDAFAVESDIAQRIVAAVGGALTAAEQGRLAAVPTTNAEAYRLYLEGQEFLLRPGTLRTDLDSARNLFVRALAADSGFALAHAALSEVDGRMFWWRYDVSPERARRQRQEAEIALRLAPGLPQAHAAMGLTRYWGERDYRRALEEFRTALEGMPGDVRVWGWIVSVERRLGHWEDAAKAFEKAAQLDPRNANLFLVQGGAGYQEMHRYADAIAAYDRALRLSPSLYVAAVQKGWSYVRWRGQTDTLRLILDRLPGDAELGAFGSAAAQRAALLFWRRQADSLLRFLAGPSPAVFEAQAFLIPRALYDAWAHQLRGEPQAMRAALDSALRVLDSIGKERPDDWRVHSARGLALAGLGRRGEARQEAEWLRASEVYRSDATDGPNLAEDRAKILAQVGDADGALDEIGRLLVTPSFVTVPTLRLNPLWDPVRADPRFQGLLAGPGGR